jgi:hypothetical protein
MLLIICTTLLRFAVLLLLPDLMLMLNQLTCPRTSTLMLLTITITITILILIILILTIRMS